MRAIPKSIVMFCLFIGFFTAGAIWVTNVHVEKECKPCPEITCQDSAIGQKQAPVERQPDKGLVAQVYAYNADVGQTDGNPTVMASGKTVYDGAIANNCLKFGDQVEIAGITYTVEDRMNKRYGCSAFDIFMTDFSKAKEWGVRTLPVKIYYK